MTAQAAYLAIEITDPFACVLLPSGVIGIVTTDHHHRSGTTPDRAIPSQPQPRPYASASSS